MLQIEIHVVPDHPAYELVITPTKFIRARTCLFPSSIALDCDRHSTLMRERLRGGGTQASVSSVPKRTPLNRITVMLLLFSRSSTSIPTTPADVAPSSWLQYVVYCSGHRLPRLPWYG